jgi:DNA mismatch endonuclease (patch repair protein)
LSAASTDVFSPAERSAVMRRVKGKDTGPERQVRRIVTDLGLRYRLHRHDLPGSPDMALGPRRTAIFVHGCFWHGHDCRRGARQPKQNAAYWTAKIDRNRARDAENQAALRQLGWAPLVLWECELKDPAAVSARLTEALGLGVAV